MNEKKIIVNYLITKAITQLDELQLWQENLAEKAKSILPPELTENSGQYALHKCMEFLANDIRNVMNIIEELDGLLEEDAQ